MSLQDRILQQARTGKPAPKNDPWQKSGGGLFVPQGEAVEPPPETRSRLEEAKKHGRGVAQKALKAGDWGPLRVMYGKCAGHGGAKDDDAFAEFLSEMARKVGVERLRREITSGPVDLYEGSVTAQQLQSLNGVDMDEMLNLATQGMEDDTRPRR